MELVTVVEWKPVAQHLKAACKAHGLLADHGVTADAARILRPVGSLNWKYDPPRPVKLIKGADPYDMSELSNILAAATPTGNADIGHTVSHRSAPHEACEVSEDVATQVNPNGYDLADVEEALKRLDPFVGRAEWRNIGFPIADAFGEAGRDLFVRWSRGDLWEVGDEA